MAKHLNDLSISNLLSRHKFTGFASLNRYRVEFHLPRGFADGGITNIANVIANTIDKNSSNTPLSEAAKLLSGLTGQNDLAGTNSNSGQSKIRYIENNINDNGLISLYCESCSMPGRTLLTYDHRQLSTPYRVPYSQSPYDPITMSFLTDSDFNTRTYFETWQGAVLNVGSNTVNYYDEFVSDMRIILINTDGYDSEYYVDLFECFPITIGQVDLGYANGDIAKIPITFSYKYWQSSADDTSIMRFQ
ncbi:MAG: hypothetical protein PHC28_15765 [Flavobacterium sp.]|uniref:hypothetical protein n=1 Tax=Flavobacterium sp. TaxID=239 RepID=UPI0026145A95|nr:hypothetical protein [Flavobacterium sp.]MDD5151911.1 hypothetical protein [Flavobacterium sp.]